MSRYQLSAEQVADALNGSRARTKRTTQGFMALCPNHDDRNPSLSVRQTESGRILLNCFATSCPDARQVYAAAEQFLNLEAGGLGGPREGYQARSVPDKVKNVRPTFEPIMPVPADAPLIARKARTKKLGNPTKIWAYKNGDGQPMAYVARYDIPATDDQPASKIIWPWTFGVREGRREWCVGAMPEPRIPFNLDKIVTNPNAPILLHEGEKSSDAGEILFPNWVSSSTVGGGSAPHMTDFSHFAGRIVIISPDNDAAGMEFVSVVAAELLKVGASVFILRFPTNFIVKDGSLVKKPYIMEEGDDMADHLERGWTTELLREAIEQSSNPLIWKLEDWDFPEGPSD